MSALDSVSNKSIVPEQKPAQDLGLSQSGGEGITFVATGILPAAVVPAPQPPVQSPQGGLFTRGWNALTGTIGGAASTVKNVASATAGAVASTAGVFASTAGSAASSALNAVVPHFPDYAKKKDDLEGKLKALTTPEFVDYIEKQVPGIQKSAIDAIKDVVKQNTSSYIGGTINHQIDAYQSLIGSIIHFALLKTTVRICEQSSDNQLYLGSPDQIFLNLLDSRAAGFQEYLDRLANPDDRSSAKTIRDELRAIEDNQALTAEKRTEAMTALFKPFVKEQLKMVLPNGLAELEIPGGGLINSLIWSSVENGAAAFFAKAYDGITQPQRDRTEYINTLAAAVGPQSPEELKESKEIVEASSRLAANQIVSQVRHMVAGKREYIVGEMDAKLPDNAKLTPDVKKNLQEFINNIVATEGHEGIQKTWDYLETIVQTAILRAASKSVALAQREPGASAGQPLAQIVLHLVNALGHCYNADLDKARNDEEARYTAAKNAATPNQLPNVEKEHQEKLGEVYKQSSNELLKHIFPGGADDLPLPAMFRDSLFSYAKESLVPQFIAEKHQIAIDWQGRSQERQQKLNEEYKSRSPEIFVDVVGEYVQRRAASTLKTLDADSIEGAVASAEKFLHAQIDESQAALDKTQPFTPAHHRVQKRLEDAKRIASYLEAHKKGLIEKVAADVHAVGENKAMQEQTLALAKNYAKGAISDILTGLSKKLTSGKKANTKFDEEVSAAILHAMAHRLQAAKKQGDVVQGPLTREATEAAEKDEHERLVALSKKLLEVTGVTKETLAVNDMVWGQLVDTILPLTMKSILDNFANEHSVNKAVRAALRNYHESLLEDAKNPGIVTASKGTPPNPEDPLNKAAEELLREVVDLTGDKLLKWLMLGPSMKNAGHMVGDVIREQFKHKSFQDFIAQGLDAASETLVEGGQIKPDEHGIKRLYDKNNIEIKGKYPFEIAENDEDKIAISQKDKQRNDKAAEDVQDLLGKVAKQKIKNTVRDGIRGFWRKWFQNPIDWVIEKTCGRFSEGIKKVLHGVCHQVFGNFFGTILKVAAWPLSSLFLHIAAKRTKHYGGNLVKGLHKALDRRGTLEVSEELLSGVGNVLNKPEDEKDPRDLQRHLHPRTRMSIPVDDTAQRQRR